MSTLNTTTNTTTEVIIPQINVVTAHQWAMIRNHSQLTAIIAGRMLDGSPVWVGAYTPTNSNMVIYTHPCGDEMYGHRNDDGTLSYNNHLDHRAAQEYIEDLMG